MGWLRVYPKEVDTKGIHGVYCDNTAVAKPGFGCCHMRPRDKRQKWSAQGAQNRVARADINRQNSEKRISAEAFHEALYALSNGTR